MAVLAKIYTALQPKGSSPSSVVSINSLWCFLDNHQNGLHPLQPAPTFTMPRRAPSPAFSEHEVDIAGSLFANEADSDVELDNKKPADAAADLDFNSLLNTRGDDESGDDDGDEAFIAMQQRRSNRKTTNLLGKTVKKGGGFQSMGECPAPSPVITCCMVSHS
jgi:hypothetical protein